MKEQILFGLHTFSFLALPFGSNINTVGKTTKAISKEIAIPALIIHPRLIMGLILETISEEKPAMVVTMAKKVGFALLSMVKRINFRLVMLGYFPKSSL